MHGDAAPSPSTLLDAAGLASRYRSLPDSPQCTVREHIITRAEEAAQILWPYVQRNEPCVLRQLLTDWPPTQLWNDEYVRSKCGSAQVNVREVISADGRVGDASTPGVYSKLASMSMAELLDVLKDAEAHHANARVYGAQIRLRTSLRELFADTRPQLPVLEAMGPLWRNSPSLYVGCGARSPLHFDCLDNLLCIVGGRKQISLWHPAHANLLYAGGGNHQLFSKVDDVLAPQVAAIPARKSYAPPVRMRPTYR